MKRVNHIRVSQVLSLVPALLTMTLSTTTAQAEQVSPRPFSMTVVSDRAEGKSILSGSFDSAIDKISERSDHRQTSFEIQNNLCVAYAKAKQLEQAIDACEAAMRSLQAKKDVFEGRRYLRTTKREAYIANLSIALSNQGVLYAVSGEHAQARDNFMAAMDLETDRSAARDNLHRLSSIEQ